MSFRRDASHGPESAGGAIRENEISDGDVETTRWKARRGRVTTVKSLEPGCDDTRERAVPSIAVEYAAESASAISPPASPPPMAQLPPPSPRRRLPRGRPVAAVALGAFAYVSMSIPAAVQPRTAATKRIPCAGTVLLDVALDKVD